MATIVVLQMLILLLTNRGRYMLRYRPVLLLCFHKLVYKVLVKCLCKL